MQRTLGLMFFILLAGPTAWANSFTYWIPGRAEATITTGTDTISILLTDLVTNPSSVTDNLSALIFTTSVAPASESIASGAAATRTIASNKTYTDAGTVAPGWSVSLVSATTTLDDLGAAGPAHTIIGAPGTNDKYTNANGSLTNGSHNPFLAETATWTLNAAGITGGTDVTSVIFQFGTSDGHNRTAGTLLDSTTTSNGTNPGAGALVATPEPSAMAMFVVGALFLAVKLAPVGIRRVRRSADEREDGR